MRSRFRTVGQGGEKESYVKTKDGEDSAARRKAVMAELYGETERRALTALIVVWDACAMNK